MTETAKTPTQRSDDRSFRGMRIREHMSRRTVRKGVVVYFIEAKIFAAHSVGNDPMDVYTVY